jgi:CshA-type fibril repeat protein
MKKLLHKFCLFFCFVYCLNLSAQSGKVLNLDGINTYMSVADHPDLDFGISQNKTVTCWVKTTTTTGTPRIFAKRNGSAGNGYEFWTGNGSNAGKFALNMSGTGTPANISTAGYSTSSIADGTWHHVALVLDASSTRTLYGYLDGVLVNTGKTFTSTTSDFSNALEFIVGATSDGSKSYKWAGQIDNVRIWNIAMTATELQADMITTITAPTTNLLAAWDFENVSGTNVPDVSGNNHPGTLFGSPTIPNAFPIVLALDGVNDYMSVVNHADFNLAAGQSLTVTCRIKTGDFSKRIMSKRPASVGYEFINNSSTGGQFGVNLNTSVGAAGPPFGTTTITDNAWHHLAMVIDVATTSCKIYVDGALQQTKTTTNISATSTVSNAGDLYFGTINNLTSFMNAQMDDIRFWSKAMTAAEILNDKTAIVTGNEANLLAAWDFENVSGTTVPDISGHNHPGTLNGGATVIAQTNTMQINSVSLVQTELPTGMGDTDQRIVAVKVSANGALSPLSVSALKFTMAGTTNIADVTNIKVYSSGTTAVFNLATATLFGSIAPAAGNLTVSGNKALVSGDNYFWITYDVAAGATEGNLLDATCESIVANSVTYNSVANSVAGNRVVLLANTLLFTPGDAGSSNYRIPAIITAADGSLVTVTDKRWNGAGDLAAKIDPVVRRSTDNGKTWSAPLTIANFGGPNGAGDAVLVLDKTTGNLLCLFVAEKGFFASTAAAPIKIQYCRSTDNGITWGAPVDITNQIYGAGCSNPITQNWLGVFIGSGRAHQLRDGTIVAALTVRETSGGINNYMMSSTDGGITWTPSTGIAEAGGDEAKIVELNNGNLMMSIRNAGTRRFNISTDKGLTWGTAYNQADLSDPNCDGDFIRYTSTLDGYDKNRLLHTIPFAGNRTNVSVLMSTDEGTTWPVRKTIFSGASAYSSITVLPDGTMGIYYENGENSTYQMYFVRFSLKWLTNGADTYVPKNFAPVAVADNYSVNEGATLTTLVATGVLFNDTDADGNTITAIKVTDPINGTLTQNTNGSFTYVHNGSKMLTDSYTYKVNDGTVDGNTVTVSIIINPVNDAPVANNDSKTTNEDTPITIAVTANDTDADGTIDGTTVDLDPATSGIQTTFTVANEGTYTVDALGIVTFTPVPNYNGVATAVNYTVNNNLGLVSNSATINVTVDAVNDAPVAINDPKNTNEDTAVTIAVTANDTDADGTIDVATVDLDPATTGIQTIFTVANEGTYTVDNLGVVTFTPVVNYNGVATPVNYTVNDNLGLASNSAAINVTLTAVNDAPVAINDSKTTNENAPVTIVVTTNDTDVDGTIDVATVDLDPARTGIQTAFTVAGEGIYTVDALGIVTFTPVLNYNGVATPVNYTVNDNLGLVSNSAAINITVNPNTNLNSNDFNIDARSSISSFPNPTIGRFEIKLPTTRKEVVIELYTMTSQLISKRIYPVVNNLVRLSVENEATGVYMAKIYLETVVNLKIIKK